METLASILGYVVVGIAGLSGIGAVLLWLFRTVAEKWLGAKFDRQLTAFKHEQQIEIERLKLSVSAQLDRATRLHQREFDVLPKAWGKLKDAYGLAVELVSRGQAFPDLNSMTSNEQLEDFLKSSSLADWQRDLVRAATDKTEAYRNQYEPHRIGRAKRASAKFYQYFQRNGIFIRPSIKGKFDKVDELILNALTEKQSNFQHGFRLFEASDKLRSEGKEILDDLEAVIQKRLWDSTDQGDGG
jgi:hypothetical protein